MNGYSQKRKLEELMKFWTDTSLCNQENLSWKQDGMYFHTQLKYLTI